MSEENVQIGWRCVEAFNRRDPEAFAAHLTPDAVVVPLRAALEGNSYRGREGVASFFAETDEIWGEVSVELDEDPTAADGDTVYVRGRVKGRGHDSGVHVEMEVAWVLRFRDGLIFSFRTYTDLAEARQDAGLTGDTP